MSTLTDKIINILSEIANLDKLHIFYDMNLKKLDGSSYEEGETLDNITSTVVLVQFEDCLEKRNTEISKDLPKKIQHCLKLSSNECIKSTLFDLHRDRMYSILRKNNVGAIEINRYKNGTFLIFSIKEDGFDIDDNIEVSCPGINDITLTLGKEYFIAETKYFNKDILDDNLNKRLFTQRKLLKIEKHNSNNQYSFTFEGLEPIFSFTRGHVYSSKQTLHRLDHIIIEESKPVFIKNVLRKCSLEIQPMDNKINKNYKKIIESIISEI